MASVVVTAKSINYIGFAKADIQRVSIVYMPNPSATVLLVHASIQHDRHT